VGNVPWGAHLCLFYGDKEESLEVLVPYFEAGLRGSEFCMWVTSKPLSVDEAKEAMARAVPEFDRYLRDGQIEIIDSSQWYTKNGGFNSESIMNGWVEKLRSAFDRGLAGLRLCGYTSWLEEKDWDAFIKYEDEVGDLIERSKVIALCSYPLSKCEATRLIDVVSNHHYSLIKREDRWTLVENKERSRAVQETRAVEAQYRRTADNIGVAIYSALPDESSATVLVTDRIVQITGYRAEEFYSDPSLWAKIVHPADSAMVWRKIKEHREKRTPLNVEYRIVRKDGQIRWVKDSAYPCIDKSGEIERIDGFMEDMTDRRRIEEALRESEERLSLAQKAAKIGSWDWDISSGGLTWSDEIEPMFGFGPGEFSGTYEAFLDCVHPDDRASVEGAVRECMESGTDYEIEHRIVWPNGSVRWISEKGNVVKDTNGKPIRMVGIAQDITRSKLSELRIKELNKDLARKTTELTAMNRELEAFCYSVSHDLRSPLRRIEGFGQLLMEDAMEKLGETEKDYLMRITSATMNMDQLIDDLLKLSRASTVGISAEPLDLGELAREVADQLQKSDPGRTVRFETAAPLVVSGDRALLRIALENLLGNAWKFTAKTEKSLIEFGSRQVEERRIFYVRDNGAGFDQSHADKMFKPFQRLHSPSEFPGSGIGLAIVSRIIERHGGRIWAESSVGNGATFFFTLAEETPRPAL